MTGRKALLSCALLLTAGCSGSRHPALEDLRGHEDLSRFQLTSIRGTREGDRLGTEASWTGGASTLAMSLRFAIGSPTSLESGIWKWDRNGALESGGVRARSITFLGGQSGPPSIGGTFDLLTDAGVPRYRVRIPTSELKTRLDRAP